MPKTRLPTVVRFTEHANNTRLQILATTQRLVAVCVSKRRAYEIPTAQLHRPAFAMEFHRRSPQQRIAIGHRRHRNDHTAASVSSESVRTMAVRHRHFLWSTYQGHGNFLLRVSGSVRVNTRNRTIVIRVSRKKDTDAGRLRRKWNGEGGLVFHETDGAKSRGELSVAGRVTARATTM